MLVSGDTNTGERKEVTVLLADLAGSLAISDSLDPEDTHELMDGFFALALDAVHREGGTLNQFRGDGFMALFGAPRARGDDAGRALRAALRIGQDARAYAVSVKEKFGLPFELRMGVNTGLVWVGAIGADLRKDYTAEGPTVGIAARLEAEAEPGQILVGHETARRCADHFDLEYIGPRTVRGLSGTTIVFELVGARTERTRLDVERRKGLTPFISRTAELDLLKARGTPSDTVRCVEIRGETGIGKSRLLMEFVAGLPNSVAKVTLQSREADSRRAYVPWLEALRRETKPEGWATDVDPFGQEQTKDSGDVEADVRSLLERAAGSGGVVVIIDDAQWLDPSSRRVIQSLMDRPPTGAISFVATLSHDGNLDWGAPVGVEQIKLGPLADDDRRNLGRAILGSSQQAEALVEIAALRGGGNPLFIEELSRSLRDGTESLRRAAWLEVSLLNAVEVVPDSLRGVVAARVDRLPELAKQCLESAAVIARDFDTSLLADALGTHDSLTDVLQELCALGLLRPTSGGFGFSHGVVREVAYGQLVRTRRIALHARVAHALETRNVERSPDGASRIGAHYDAAGDSLRAAPLLESSGRHYAKIGSPAEASSHLMRALEILRSETPRHLAKEAAISLVLASCLNALDHSSEAAAVLDSIDVDAADRADRSAISMASIQSGWTHFMHENDLPVARRLIERGIVLVEGLPDSHRALTLGHSYLGRMLALDGDLDAAIRHSRLVVDLAAGESDSAGKLIALYNLSQTLCDSGELAAARTTALEAQELGKLAESQLLRAMAGVAFAKVLLFEGDASAAASTASLACSAAESARQRGLLHSSITILGYAQLQLDTPRDAHQTFERLRLINEKWPATSLHRARGLLETARYGEAEDVARSCLASSPPRMLRARALSVLGLALCRAEPDSRTDAEAALTESISLCFELKMRPYLAEAHHFMAEMLLGQGDRRGASYFATEAEAGYRKCSMHAHAADVSSMGLDSQAAPRKLASNRAPAEDRRRN